MASYTYRKLRRDYTQSQLSISGHHMDIIWHFKAVLSPQIHSIPFYSNIFQQFSQSFPQKFPIIFPMKIANNLGHHTKTPACGALRSSISGAATAADMAATDGCVADRSGCGPRIFRFLHQNGTGAKRTTIQHP